MTNLFFAERGSASLHLWIGPFGLHLFWPDVWMSRPDFCGRWHQPVDAE